MSDDLGPEIRSLFAKAVLEHEAARHLSADEWAAYQRIQADHAAQVRSEERRFDLEYQTRFEVARKRIIDEGGNKDNKLIPRRFGSDKFDAAAIDRQADRDIRRAHADLVESLNSQRSATLTVLFASNSQRRNMGRIIKADFSKAADPPSGPDRPKGRQR